MSERLIKPYEISVWEDKLTNGVFTETKMAVIGSDTMTGYNKVYNPVFNKKSNGEKTLSFSLKYRYFDPYSGNDGVINPFAALLVNERKIKLHYDNKWYEFIIKDHTESSDGLEWTYTCTDAFVLELSKNGYNITFDTELNNNQGTAHELARETVKNTDWQVGDSIIGKQMVAEPIYQASLVSTSGIEIINVDSKQSTSEIQSGATIYLFYSYVKNQNGKFVQFIIRDENRQYTIDDKNVITDTNYRITTELTYKSDGFYLGNNRIISWGNIEERYQANRIVYAQRTTYDPVMGRTVNVFQAGDQEVYQYTDYTYTTSNVVTNFITNGDNFNVLEDGTLQGWNPYVDFTGRSAENPKPDPLELVTKPELSSTASLADLSTLSQIEGFLKVNFKGVLTNDYKNAIYNSGFKDNAAAIGAIAKGDKFVFRYRGTANNLDKTSYTQKLGLIVAKYKQDNPGWGYYYKYIKPSDIILRFEPTQDKPAQRLNNYITGGSFDEHGNYVINNIVQIPSTKYIYKVDNTEYVWNGITGEFEVRALDSSNYIPYYYLTAEARQAVPSSILTDPAEKIGIFVYHVDNEQHSAFYIQDIQLTRFIPDADGKPIVLGNIPTATSVETDYYYVKPSEGTAAEDIETYTSVEAISDAVGTTVVPIYNEDSEKVLSISVSQSNCFDILQTIAETFECWVDLVVGHDSRGYITYTNDKPDKYVYLREYAGEDNWAGFKYGINLNSIERTVNSDEIVTKLIVDSSQSEYVDEGYVSITGAPSNQSGESYIINFDYYYSQGLLNKTETEEDRLDFITTAAQLNKQLQDKEKQRRDLEAALTSLGSNRNVFTELIETAQDTLTRALAEFEQLTGQTYEDYRRTHDSLEDDNDKLTEEETIFDLLGEIYTSSATINNYAGILSNVEQEYWNTRRALRGAEDYTVKVWVGEDYNEQRHVYVELSDFLPNFEFILGGETYTGTVSIEYWDITTNETEITFTAPTGYSIDSAQYTIDDNKVATFKITGSEEIEGVEDEIKDLQEQKDELVNDFCNKYSRYIQEGTWNSTDYIDSELYYLDALQVSNTSAQPAVSYTINVVEISELEGLEWYTFDAGDKTYIEDTEFFGWADVNGVLTPAREEVIVSEVEWHLDEPDQNIITVQNYKTRFEDLFQRISATVQTVQYNEATYAKISTLLDANGTLNQNVLLDSLNRISGEKYNLTSDGSVVIEGDHILVRNLTNPANRVIINSEGIRISSDGGVSWRTAIDGQGINIGTVYTGTLNTNNVVIGNSDNPSFRWDKSGISAYKSDGTITIDGQIVPKYDLQTYVRYDEYGLYGIKNNGAFKAQSLSDVLDKAHFAVTWDGFFIKNSYEGGGRVEITSDNDFRVLKTVNNEEKEVIKIGALEWNGSTTPVSGVSPSLYGIRITNDSGIETFKTGNDGNITITGIINATGGNFSSLVTVGKDDSDNTKPYIEIDGTDSVIKSSNYNGGPSTSATYGWMINADGDAVFNNITARGAIKTAVFEYAEIQAVGGIFIFRPSSTIRDAQRVENTDDIKLTLEKPYLFKVGDWCKISNYTDSTGEPQATSVLSNNGLVHVYRIKSIDSENSRIIILENAYNALIVDSNTKVINDLTDLIGGALVDMGDNANGNGKVGNNNYGIGINSSDNVVNLPRRAISLFETIVDTTKNPKVSYNYRGILGTLPSGLSGVNQSIYQHMEGTQGIYTDNMYIGDATQFISFYEDTDDLDGQGNPKKKLRIKANEIMFEVSDPEPGEDPWKDIADIEAEGTPGPPGPAGKDGEDTISVAIISSAGDKFLNGEISTRLTCIICQGTSDITNQFNSFLWTNKDSLGVVTWTRTTAVPYIDIGNTDISSKAVITCEVTMNKGE